MPDRILNLSGIVGLIMSGNFLTSPRLRRAAWTGGPDAEVGHDVQTNFGLNRMFIWPSWPHSIQNLPGSSPEERWLRGI